MKTEELTPLIPSSAPAPESAGRPHKLIATCLVAGVMCCVGAATVYNTRTDLSLGDAAPIFVHIPRTGGTTVEDLLFKNDVLAGYCSFLKDHQVGYEISTAVECPEWHTPPATKLPNSFTIKRSPYTRLMSEFERTFPDQKDDCNFFSRWLVDVLGKEWGNEGFQCMNDAGFTSEGMAMCSEKFPDDRTFSGGCHLLPQVAFTQQVETILEFEDFDGSVIKYLQDNVSPGVKNEVLNGDGGRESNTCWESGQVSEEAWELVNNVFRLDFRDLGYTARPFPGVVAAVGEKEVEVLEEEAKELEEVATDEPEPALGAAYDWPECYYAFTGMKK